MLSYLIVWMLPLAAFCWGAVLIPLVDAVQSRGWSQTSARPAFAGVAVCLALLVTSRTSASAIHTPLPRQDQAQAVQVVLNQLRPELHPGDRVRIEGVGDDFFEGWVGVLYGVSQQVHTFYTSDGAAGQKWGTAHRWAGQPVDYTLTLAVSKPNEYQDPVAACLRQPGEHLIASWNQLSDVERTEYRRLMVLNAEDKGKLPADLSLRYNQLGDRAFRIAVFRGSQLCGF